MADPYPFRGIWRWVVLPSLLGLAGLLAGLAGALAGNAGKTDIGYWLIQGFVKAAVEGGALAIGKRPIVALGAALVLGGLSIWTEQGLMNLAFGGAPGRADARLEAILGYGVVSMLMILVHLVYLRARRRGARAAVAAGVLYPAAGVAGMGIFTSWIYAHADLGRDLVLWGVAEGLLAWAALVVAARLSERTTSSGTV